MNTALKVAIIAFLVLAACHFFSPEMETAALRAMIGWYELFPRAVAVVVIGAPLADGAGFGKTAVRNFLNAGQRAILIARVGCRRTHVLFFRRLETVYSLMNERLA